MTGIIGVVYGATIIEPIPDDLKLKTSLDKMLNVQETDWIETEKDKDGEPTGRTINKGRIMQYDYITNKEASGDFIFDDRNYTNAQIISENGNEKTVAFYSGDRWYKDPIGKVYEIEHGATTTINAYNAQISFFQKVAHAANLYVGAGDGFVKNLGLTVWSTVQGAADGTATDSTGTNINILVGKDVANFEINRGFVPVDTSPIPDDAIIKYAEFRGFVSGKFNSDNDGDDWINMIGTTTQASVTTLGTADYDQCGRIDEPTENAGRLDITGIAINTYVVWIFNAVGLGGISLTGNTMLGMREGHDALDRAYAGANNTNSGIQMNSSTGARPPYLVVTYIVPFAPAAILQGQMIINGNVIIK